jgi:hypothetical protein
MDAWVRVRCSYSRPCDECALAFINQGVCTLCAGCWMSHYAWMVAPQMWGGLSPAHLAQLCWDIEVQLIAEILRAVLADGAVQLQSL